MILETADSGDRTTDPESGLLFARWILAICSPVAIAIRRLIRADLLEGRMVGTRSTAII